MNTFLGGFLVGIVVGPLVVAVLRRLGRIPFIKRQLVRVRRLSGGLFWRGVEKLLNYLDGLLARKREREASELGSPNLASPAGKGVVTYADSPPVK
jgi:phosphatidylglycerophosphate synthase